MKLSTSLLVKTYMDWLKSLDQEQLRELNDRCESEYDRMHFFFVKILELTEEKSVSIVDDFSIDMQIENAKWKSGEDL